MTPTFSRRQALGVLGAGAATVVAGAWWLGQRDDEEAPAAPPSGPVVESNPLDDALAAVGVAYLAAYPAEDDVDQLHADLDADESTALDALLEAHADDIAAEHAAGTVVDVDGWVLARTEARIGALAARR